MEFDAGLSLPLHASPITSITLYQFCILNCNALKILSNRMNVVLLPAAGAGTGRRSPLAVAADGVALDRRVRCRCESDTLRVQQRHAS